MKFFPYVLVLSSFLIPLSSHAQSVNFEDGFEDGDFANNPSWIGDTNEFTVIDSSPNYLLQLNGDDQDGGVSYLSTPSSNVTGSWEFYVNLDFSPSGGNRADIFLMSDIANLEGAVNGYALRAGESGSSDVFRLIRYDEGAEAATILSGTTDISTGGAFRVKVTRQAGGSWTLEVAEGYDGDLAQEGGSQTDNTYTSANYFGVRATYTSSRYDLFYFDFKIDLPPFATTGADLADSNTIDVGFNRAVDQASVTASDFSADHELGTPASVSFPAADTVRLEFDQALPSRRYRISVSGVTDLSGNAIQAGSSESVIVFGSYVEGDVLINEFVYDPPSGQAEYVELVNTSDKYLDLANWGLGDDGGTESFGTNPVVLAADSFLVVSADTAALATVYGARAYFELDQLAAFNNGGDAVQLTTNSGSLADSLTYTSDWGGTDVALERRSVATPSIYPENWGDSPNANGGTPGLPNELSDDNTPPSISGYDITGSQTIMLFFSERVESNTAGNSSNYSLSPGITINSAEVTEPDTVELALNAPLQNAADYTLTASAVEDIFGNAIPSEELNFTYYEISQADSGDIFINEFVYDPGNRMTEFVELYNPTPESFNLQGWTLNDNTGNRRTISNSQFVVPPDSFVVIAPDSTLLNSFSNFSLVVMGNGFPALNNSVDDIVIRRADGARLDSLRYSTDWGGNEISLERRSTSVSGIFRENWDNSPTGTGTPGQANHVAGPDSQPPSLQSVEIINNRTLQLLFSETVIAGPAESPANYHISGGIGIAGATIFEPDTVQLDLDSDLQNATEYTLTVSGIEDVFGNSMTSEQVNVVYFEISNADSGEVFVNEFMFDPPEGETEYIELYNPTQKSFDLEDWIINDNTGNRRTITSSQFIIPPDSFAVIAPDSTLIERHPELNLITMGGRFPSLNNSGDDVVLRRPDGTLMDSLRYRSAWGGNDVALERKTTTVSAIFRENWGNPTHGTGTPGRSNSLEPDESPPDFVSVNFLDSTTIQLAFSETIEPQSATTASNYEISPPRNIQLIAADQDTITLLLSSDLESGTTYEITVSNLQDIFGNEIETISRSREYLLFSQGRPGDVVINEVLYERAGATGPEFVELYNRSSQNFDLRGWQFGDGSELIDINTDIQLKADSYLFLTGNEGFANAKFNGYHLDDFPALNDDEDAVYIRSDRQVTIDSLYYYARWGGGNGTSIERKDPAAASNDASNWITSQSQGGISAGNDNGSFSPDETPPDVIFSTRRPDGLIEVRFNEFIQLTEELAFMLEGTQLQVAMFDSTQGNQILLQEPSAKGKAKSLNITIQNLTDVKGNSTPSASIPLAEAVEPGSVVINEIMFNPLDEPDDNQPDQSEYLELRNTQDYAISLEGFTLHDAPDENREVRRLVPVNSTSKFLPPEGHLLVHAEDQADTFAESKTAIFFELSGFDPNRTVQIDRGTLSLSSQDDAIYLADSTGATIDSVFYDQSWHNPNIVDTRGVALERINPAGPSGDAENWSSSTTEKGGTPGSENSIFQVPENEPEDIGISFDPNPFSPDGDGREDNLFINYKLDQPDYLLKVRIYDRYGRLVRELADGKQAGFEGTLQWDGRTDEGNRNRIGIYIVLFEAYDSSEGSDRTFKETVVLARQF